MCANAAYYQLTQKHHQYSYLGRVRSDNVELNKTDKTEYRYLQDGVLQPTQGHVRLVIHVQGYQLMQRSPRQW